MDKNTYLITSNQQPAGFNPRGWNFERAEVIRYLREQGFWLKKSLGQHFLIDRGVLREIIEAAQLNKNDTVIEIGPGIGTLTYELLPRVKEVIAIERDRELGEKLREKKIKNLKIIIDNAIFTLPSFTLPSNYKVVSNLPYSISSPILNLILLGDRENNPPPPKLAVLLLQWELAKRLVAKPGDSGRGILTVIRELVTDTKIITKVSRRSFFPVPRVDSAIFLLKDINRQKYLDDPEKIIPLVKVGFSQKRRQLHNALHVGLHLDSLQVAQILKDSEIDPNLRAEDLSVEDWLRLYRVLS